MAKEYESDGGAHDVSDEIWAVEISESAGSRGNFEAFTVAVQDRVSQGKGMKICIKLITVTTNVPCGLGLSLPVSKMDRRSIKAHEKRLLENLAKPIMSSPAGRKVKPKYLSVKNDKWEEGLIRFTRKSSVKRLYISAKTKDVVKELSMDMPSGCRVVGVQGGRKIAEVTAAAIEMFDSRLDPLPGGLNDSRTFSDSFTDYSFTLSDSHLRFSRTLPTTVGGSFKDRGEQQWARALQRSSTSFLESASRLPTEQDAGTWGRRLSEQGPVGDVFGQPVRSRHTLDRPSALESLTGGRLPGFDGQPELTRAKTWKEGSGFSPDVGSCIFQQSTLICSPMRAPLSPTILEGSVLESQNSNPTSPLFSPFSFIPSSMPLMQFSAPLASLSIHEEYAEAFVNEPRTYLTASFPLKARGHPGLEREEEEGEEGEEEGDEASTPGAADLVQRDLTVRTDMTFRTDSSTWSVGSPWGLARTPSSEQHSQSLNLTVQPNRAKNLSHSLTLQPSQCSRAAKAGATNLNRSGPLIFSHGSPSLKTKLKKHVNQSKSSRARTNEKAARCQGQKQGVLKQIAGVFRDQFHRFTSD